LTRVWAPFVNSDARNGRKGCCNCGSGSPPSRPWRPINRTATGDVRHHRGTAVTIGQGVWSVLRDHDWMLVIFTAILAIFTFRLWRTTYKDTRILQRAYIAVEPQGV